MYLGCYHTPHVSNKYTTTKETMLCPVLCYPTELEQRGTAGEVDIIKYYLILNNYLILDIVLCMWKAYQLSSSSVLNTTQPAAPN